jgi:hypothetical protein
VATIRLIAMRPGEAPEEVRRAWVGLAAPVTEPDSRLRDQVKVVGVRSGPHGFFGQLWAMFRGRGETRRGCVVESRKCIGTFVHTIRSRLPGGSTTAPSAWSPGGSSSSQLSAVSFATRVGCPTERRSRRAPLTSGGSISHCRCPIGT